ncbi:hypothetical protein QQ045_007077 [Rhodiola kirilowii]
MGAWTEQESFQEIVKASWAGKAHSNPLLNCALKLKRLRIVLRKWNWETFGDVNAKVRQLTKRVELMESDATVPKAVLTQTKEEVSHLLRYQFAMLDEKSKISWITEGDRNSSFFHASIKARRAHNKMKLEMTDGSYSEEPDLIGNKAVDYFRDLFGTFPPTHESGGASAIHSSIFDEQNSTLIRTPDEEEVKSAAAAGSD